MADQKISQLTALVGAGLAAADEFVVVDTDAAETKRITFAEMKNAFQPVDAELTAIAGLTSAADRLPYFDGSESAALATFTSFARTLLDDANAATARATLGLVIGTNIPALAHNHQSAGAGGQLDHGAALTGLTDDDHTQYTLLAGRSGGQTITGGTGSGDDLTLGSTSHGTKGSVVLAAGTDLDCSDERVGNIKVATFVDEHDNGTKTSAFTVDWGEGQKQKVTLNAAGPHTVTLTAPAGPANLILKVIQGATPGTLTWPASVKWPGGTAFTLSTTTGDEDLISFYYDGTNYYAQGAADFS